MFSEAVSLIHGFFFLLFTILNQNNKKKEKLNFYRNSTEFLKNCFQFHKKKVSPFHSVSSMCDKCLFLNKNNEKFYWILSEIQVVEWRPVVRGVVFAAAAVGSSPCLFLRVTPPVSCHLLKLFCQ